MTIAFVLIAFMTSAAVTVIALASPQLAARSAASGGCQGGVSVPQQPVGNFTPVLLMQPNTVGYVCVTYKAAWSDDPSIFNEVVSTSPFFSNGTYSFGMWIGNNSTSNAFIVTPTPSSVRPSANVTQVTVQYKVTVLANSSGIYDYSAPYGYCGSIPMAVGYSVAQLNGSDFPSRPFPHSCFAEPYAPVSVNVSGIGVALEDIAPSRLYLYGGTGCGEGSGTGYSGNVPCFTYDKSSAYVFDCLTAAATPSGCTASFGSYKVTVWYPEDNESQPWANCAYAVSNSYAQTPRSFEDCYPLSSSSFIVASAPQSLT